MFRTEHGLEGSPSVAQIRRALMQTLDASHGGPTTADDQIAKALATTPDFGVGM